MSRIPGASSQRSTFSVSSAVAAGTGPGAVDDRLGTRPELMDEVMGVGTRRDHTGRGQATVSDDVHRPSGVVLAPGRDDLGTAGQRGEPLGASRRAHEGGEPVAVHAGVLEPVEVGQRRHPPLDRVDDLVGTVKQGVAQLTDHCGVRRGVGAAVTGSQALAHLGQHARRAGSG